MKAAHLQHRRSDERPYEGCQVQVAPEGTAGLRLASGKQLDLVILDVMLLNLSGLDVCKQRRNNGSDLTIIMLTAFGQEIDKGLGLHIGADDFTREPQATPWLRHTLPSERVSLKMDAQVLGVCCRSPACLLR